MKFNLLTLLFLLWTFPSLALDPHYTNSSWAKAMDHLKAAKTAKDPASELREAKKNVHGMTQRSDNKLEQINWTHHDIDEAIEMAKKGGRERMVQKIDSAMAHLRAAK